MKSLQGLAKDYLRFFWMTLGVGLVSVPYVWFTNVSIGRTVILVDAVSLCLIIPVFMVLSERALKKLKTDSKSVFASFAAVGGYLLALGFGVLFMLPIHSLMLEIPTHPTQFVGRAPFFAALLPAFFLYVVALLILDVFKRREVELALSAERDRSAFSALAAQIKPHFLFNALNTLEELIDANPNHAKECVRGLAFLYRKILESSKQTYVSLAQEVELCEKFAQIQKFRFGDKLDLHWKISEEVKGLRFPPNMMLTLVENAIKHGVEKSIHSSPLEVEARVTGEVLPRRLEVIVKNYFLEGKTEKVIQSGLGFGLYEIRARLDLLYGKKAELKFENLGNRVVVNLALPAETL